MKKTLLALPALVILLGVGGAATVYAHDLGRIADLTEEQKTSLATVKDLIHQGKFEEAKQLAQESGLPELKHGLRLRLDPEKKQALDAALESGDYAAFTALSANTPLADELTPEAFAKLVEAHTLMEAGDMDGAKDILKELDIRIPVPGVVGKFDGDHRKFHIELTPEQEELLKHAKTLRENGDEEGAKAILDELDLPHPPGRAFRD